MIIKRMISEETNELMIGDMINFELTDGEKIEAMAVRKEADGMVFIFVDCLAKEYSMNDNYTNKSGYEASDLRKALNGEVLKRFPQIIKDVLIAFENGDFLRLATEKEIFGENPYGDDESENIEQFEPMKQRRNRVAFQGHNGDWEWYWLQNAINGSAASFARVHYYGHAHASGASTSIGVRPCFKL